MQERRILDDSSNYILPEGVIESDKGGRPLDVLFESNDGKRLAIFHNPSIWPDEGWTPIGVVIVPTSHNRYGDGSCGVMSLKRASSLHPGEPVLFNSGGDSMPYGSGSPGNGVFLASYDNTLYATYQESSAGLKCKGYSSNVWPYAGEAYYPNEEAATQWSNNGSYVTETSGKPYCDFNGIRNTAAVYVASKDSTQWTSDTIATDGDFPCIICQARFKTPGTKSFFEIYNGITQNNLLYGTVDSPKQNTGYWYAPAVGELQYKLRYKGSLSCLQTALNNKYPDCASSLGVNSQEYSSTLQYTYDNEIGWARISYDAPLNSAAKISTQTENYPSVFLRFNGTVYEKYEERGSEVAVDLGLPSGTKWAQGNLTKNDADEYYIGTPETIGAYFSYGQLGGHRVKDQEEPYFSFASFNNNYDGFGKELTSSYTSGDTKYDAARFHLGGSWRIATWIEWNELGNNCTITESTMNNVDGFTVIGPNGNSIFLPKTGFYYLNEKNISNSRYGYYCSSSMTGYNGQYNYYNAAIVANYASANQTSSASSCEFGWCIRPIC